MVAYASQNQTDQSASLILGGVLGMIAAGAIVAGVGGWQLWRASISPTPIYGAVPLSASATTSPSPYPQPGSAQAAPFNSGYPTAPRIEIQPRTPVFAPNSSSGTVQQSTVYPGSETAAPAQYGAANASESEETHPSPATRVERATEVGQDPYP